MNAGTRIGGVQKPLHDKLSFLCDKETVEMVQKLGNIIVTASYWEI
jgi:hypothetical protein